jgi:hypothetical protein
MASFVEGTVGMLRETEEGRDRVVRWVLTHDDGRRLGVEMRGAELHGVLNEGDRVAVPDDPARRPADMTLRPDEVRNLTTGGVVRMWSPGTLERGLRAGPALVVGTAVSTAVGTAAGALVSSLFQDEGQNPGIRPGENGGSEPSSGAVAAVAVLVGLVIVLAVLLWRRFGWRPAAIVLAGFLAGVVFVAAALG